LRGQVSQLLSHGHTDAPFYPVGMVWDEARLVERNVNRLEATRATLLQMAVSSVLSEEAGKEFKKVIERLSEE
jgi:hypothetical protein